MAASVMNLVTTVIGFGMSATFLVFVCVRLVCGRVRSADPRSPTAFEFQSRISLEPGHVINGLDPIAAAAIPAVKYEREALRSSRQDTRCTICLEEYQDKEMLRIMPRCAHSFHLSCIDEWLRIQSTCPICRLTL